ncbi:MAG: hypothetical protein HC821_00135, partial [Lewinella sp.]|nr:hypothetical protein [Lewinella sp.]
MKLLYPLLCSLSLWVGFSPLRAQETTLMGFVTAAAGDTLAGATIQVLNAVVSTSTDRQGHYELEVPTGRIRLLFSCLGFQDIDTLLVLKLTDQEIRLDMALQTPTFTAPEVIVFGRRAHGLGQALQMQQRAAQQLSLVHAELFNRYPDVGLAETAQRISGLTVSRRSGE